MEAVTTELLEFWSNLKGWATSPRFYAQLGGVLVASALAYLIASATLRRVPMFQQQPQGGAYQRVGAIVFRGRCLLLPLLLVFLLGVASEVSFNSIGRDWLIRLAQSLSVIFLLYRFISSFITNPIAASALMWIGVPIGVLHVLGWLDGITTYLDGISLSLGNIRLSAYALVRAALFGSVLFWLGRISSSAGQQVIRKQETFDVGTREVLAKLFEITVFVVVFLLLLNVVGINLTALAVFGGALGVGLGFGLQQIAANFISGIIILLDRSITVGDFIELEDGRSGTLRELNMRSATLETFDGKDVMVPNERFITTSFVNWTHKNKKQRYSLEFSVAYDTDLHRLFDIVRAVVADHPMVRSGDEVPAEERPDAEISAFGDSGIEILVEFWMEGIDDGPNRVGADLLLGIWDALRANDIAMPFPQREVRILRES